MDHYSAIPGDTLVSENDRTGARSTTLAPGGMFDVHQHDQVVRRPDVGRARVQELGDVGTTGLPPLRNLGNHPVTRHILELIGEPSRSSEPLAPFTNGRDHLVEDRTEREAP